jgi:hypothetical protein
MGAGNRWIFRLLTAGTLSLLAACGSSSRPGGSGSPPLAESSPVPAPAVVGPIEGGLRGRPWGGTVASLAPLAPYGFVQEEYFFSGTALGRDEAGALTGQSAPYTSRMLVQRPGNPAKFNGTVLAEWLNVSLEFDLPAIWMLTHEELLDEGYAYVGISVQVSGVSASPLGLKSWDPVRYAPLDHPGDEYEFDIFSQAVRSLVARSGPAPLGPLQPARIIAAGESQSAALMRTYANAVQPGHRAVDGFFIHTWPGPIEAAAGVPVLMFLTETEADGATSPYGILRPVSWLGAIGGIPLGDIPGLGPVRVPIAAVPSADAANLRVWEVAGGAHGDEPFVQYAAAELSQDLTAPVALPLYPEAIPAGCVLPMNELDQARPAAAALHQLNVWLASGQAPASQPRMARQSDGRLARDADGFVSGGVRMPNYAVPIGLNRGDTCTLLGSYRAFDRARVQSLYPTAADYRAKFAAAAQQAVRQGTLLPADAAAYIDEAGAVNDWGSLAEGGGMQNGEYGFARPRQ